MIKQNYPTNWVIEKLGNVIDIQGGSQPPKSAFIYEAKDGYVQLLQIRDFGKKPVPTYVPINQVTKFCKKTDVLIARYGASLGRIVTGLEGAYNVALAKTIYDKHLFEDLYIFYLLKTSLFQTPLKMISRSAQNGFAKHEVAHIEIPIPPLNEQKRIVAKIEELFSELDNGIAALKTAREQLKVYRQSILKHAFEGKLTAKWREENADKLETPEQLLARIQKEREACYQKQLKDWERAIKEWELLGKEGNSPPRPKPPKKIISSCIESGNIPDTWRTLPLEALISFGPSNGWSPKAVAEVTSTKAITLTATTSGKFDSSHFKYIDARIPKHSSLWLKRNDILVQRGNTIEYVGVPALYTGEDNQFIYPDLIMKIHTVDSIAAQYIVYCMSMNSSRNFLRERALGAAGSMPKINQSTLSSLPIYICSALEQRKIVELLEEKLSLTDSSIQEIGLQLSKAEVFRQTILKKAFSGKLVPQNSNDEPASELLARIKTEKRQGRHLAKSSAIKNSQKKSIGKFKIENFAYRHSKF